jgi:hypothetical protein
MKHFFNEVVPILSNKFLKLPNPNEVHYKIQSGVEWNATKMLKDARMQSGVGWNATRSMIEAEDALWDNLIISFPKIHKFKTKSFPLFDALGELYDGQIAEGTYNVNSTQLPQHPKFIEVDNQEELSHSEAMFPGVEESWAHIVQEDENFLCLLPFSYPLCINATVSWLLCLLHKLLLYF